jgi:hypothetical protein
LLAIWIQAIGVSAAMQAAFPASVSRGFTVTARVVRGCGVSTGANELEATEPLSDTSNVVPPIGPILRVTCARVAAGRSVLITAADAPGRLVQLETSGDVAKHTLAILTANSANKTATGIARHAVNANVQSSTRKISSDAKVNRGETRSDDSDQEIIVVTIDF